MGGVKSFGIVLVLSILAVVVGCGDVIKPAQPVESPIEGTWRLVSVKCGGEESQVLTDGLLAKPEMVSNRVTYTGNSGTRTWEAFGCIATTPMSPITYDNGVMSSTDLPTKCSGECPGQEKACSAQGTTDKFPFVRNGSSLVVTVPPSPEFNSLCAATQRGESQMIFTRE